MFKKISLILVLVVAAFSLVSCTGQLTETGQEEQLPTVAETEVEAETEDYPRKFSGKLSLSIVSDIAIPGQAIDVDVEGSYAYVTDDLGQLYVIDVSSKENPRIVSKVRNIDSANIVIAKGSYAYISYTSWQKDAEEVYSECGFKIISILDEENPQVISNYISGKNTRKSVQVLFVNGNYAYLNTTEVINGEQINQLEIVDIENKDKPRLISKLSIEGMPWSVWASGKYAYVNTSIYQEEEETESRLLVIDIEDKDNPKKVGSCQLPEGTAGIYVEGNFAYVSNNTKGNENGSSSLKSYLQVVDISDKSSPKLMGKCEIPGQGWELDMVGSFVFVSDLEGGVFAVDITEKDNPVITDSLYTSGTSYDITLEGNFGYLADGFSGLTIILLSGEQNGPDTVKLIPQAIFEVFGDNIGEYSYPVGVPVYFSAASSYDPEGEELDFYWEIETQTLEGREISYVFNLPGEYEVSLEVSDGTYSDTATKTVKV
ncbi:MAG: PKD domain-containing protein, partial [Actinomycetota bacterium]